MGEAFEPGTCRTSAARSCAARRRAAKVACKRVQLRRASSWYLWKLNQKPRESWTEKHTETKPCVFFFGISNCQLFSLKKSGIYKAICMDWFGMCGCFRSSLSSLKSQEFGRMAWFLDLLRSQGTSSGWFHSCQYRLQALKKTYSLLMEEPVNAFGGELFFLFWERF